MRWILGFFLPIIGFLLVFYSEWMYQNLGPVPFAERYLAYEGGSRMFYKLLGVLLILIGFGFITGAFDSFFFWIAKTFFGAFMPEQKILETP